MASAENVEPAHKNHPSTATMVCEALEKMNERGGSSLQAIMKYVVTNYLLDPQRSGSYVKRYIKKAVATGELVQTKGRGALGSFKLAPKMKAKPAAPKPAAPKATATKPAAPKATASKPATSKPAAPKATASKPAAPKATASKPAAPKVAVSKSKSAAEEKQPKKEPKKVPK